MLPEYFYIRRNGEKEDEEKKKATECLLSLFLNMAAAAVAVSRTIETRMFAFSVGVNSRTTFKRNLRNNRRCTKRVQSTSFIMSHLRMTD